MGKNDDRNADSIADLKRRLMLANVILVGSIAMVPLGFFCPCGIAMACAEAAPGVSTVLAISSLLLPVVGLGAMLLMGGDRPKYKRGMALAEISQLTAVSVHVRTEEKTASISGFIPTARRSGPRTR